jgi:hypothetical protein
VYLHLTASEHGSETVRRGSHFVYGNHHAVKKWNFTTAAESCQNFLTQLYSDMRLWKKSHKEETHKSKTFSP